MKASIFMGFKFFQHLADLVILITKNTTRTLYMNCIMPPVCIPTWDICFPASLPSRYSCCSWFFCALGQKFVRVKNKGNFCINSWLIYVSLFFEVSKINNHVYVGKKYWTGIYIVLSYTCSTNMNLNPLTLHHKKHIYTLVAVNNCNKNYIA